MFLLPPRRARLREPHLAARPLRNASPGPRSAAEVPDHGPRAGDRHAPSGLAMTDLSHCEAAQRPKQSAAEVLERKAIAGRFRGPFLVENLIEVVVVVLVAVQEANHIRLCPEKDVPVEPAESERVPALPARLDPFRAVGNPLPERAERLGDLHGNRLALVVALRLKVGTLPVPQRLDRKAVFLRPRQIRQ